MDPSITTPVLTVLMPVYNTEKYIAEAVESILDQNFADFEFLIIDDASTDQTVSIIKSYADPRICLIEKHENTGYTKSLNYGLKIAKGKYIARMDGDDISMPNRFAKQLSFLDSNPNVIVCGTFYEILGTDKVVDLPINNDEIRLALLWANCLAHPSVMIRKENLINSSISYNILKEPSEDYDLWVRLLPIGEIHNIPEVLLKYRIHFSSVSRKQTKKQEKESVEVRLQLLKHSNVFFEPDEEDILRKIFSNNFSITVSEFNIFKNFQFKLKKSNKNEFFEKIGFEKYLISLEKRALHKFAYRYERYSPKIFLQYLRIKNKWHMKLSMIEELKLFFKSFFFWKI